MEGVVESVVIRRLSLYPFIAVYSCLHISIKRRPANAGLRKRRTSFEHKMFTVATVLVGLAVVGAIAYNVYVQPTQELFPECTYQTYHSCAAWLWDYAEPLAKYPY
jgi:hypothetical protein